MKAALERSKVDAYHTLQVGGRGCVGCCAGQKWRQPWRGARWDAYHTLQMGGVDVGQNAE